MNIGIRHRAALAGCLWAGVATGAVIHNESVDGDLASRKPYSVGLFTDLGSGVSSLLGRVDGGPLKGSADDVDGFDVFHFRTVGDFDVDLSATGTGALTGLWRAVGGVFSVVQGAEQAGTDIFARSGVLSAGEYFLITLPEFNQGQSDYRIDIRVAASVPGPAGLPLVFSAVLGLGLWCRYLRRKSG